MKEPDAEKELALHHKLIDDMENRAILTYWDAAEGDYSKFSRLYFICHPIVLGVIYFNKLDEMVHPRDINRRTAIEILSDGAKHLASDAATVAEHAISVTMRVKPNEFKAHIDELVQNARNYFAS